MKKYIDNLRQNPLFIGIDNNLEKLFKCLLVKIVPYKQNDIILLCGDNIKDIGVVLSGNVKVIKENINGNINILSELTKGEIFAEAFLCAGISISPVTVQAINDCEILFIDFKQLNKPCYNRCVFHTALIQNMLHLIALKSIMLNEKIEIMSCRSIREKLLLYLNIQKNISKSNKFIIPYNREELANYLGIDRSALSREICKMRNDRIINFKKNLFELL